MATNNQNNDENVKKRVFSNKSSTETNDNNVKINESSLRNTSDAFNVHEVLQNNALHSENNFGQVVNDLKTNKNTESDDKKPHLNFTEFKFTENNNSYHNSSNQIHYKNVGEYSQAVQQWIWQYQFWNNMNYYYMALPYISMNNMLMQQGQAQNPTIQIQVGQSVNGNTPTITVTGASGTRTNTNVRHETGFSASNNNNLLGTNFRIPKLWKRLCAEMIDFSVLFLIKFFTTMIIVDYMDVIDFNKYDLENLLTKEFSYDAIIEMTTELIIMEILNKILVCAYETLFLASGKRGYVGGTTPGKRYMGIKVVLCQSAQDSNNNHVTVVPATDIGLKNSFVRAAFKNFSWAFFIPVCITALFFKHKRTGYDLLAKSICVEMTAEDYEQERRFRRRRVR